MGKYTPSVKNNNALKSDVLKAANSVLSPLFRGKHSRTFLQADVEAAVASLKNAIAVADQAVTSGSEDIGMISQKVIACASRTIKQMDKTTFSTFESCLGELIGALGDFADITNGEMSYFDASSDADTPSGVVRKLEKKLEELESIKAIMSRHENRLEEQIVLSEKSVNELNSLMLSETNTRKIEDYFTKMKVAEGSVGDLHTRKKNYSACHGILEKIYTNMKEMIEACKISPDKIGEAKAYLNIDALKNILDQPEKALAILKKIQEKLNNTAQPTSKMQNALYAGAQSVSNGLSPEVAAHLASLRAKDIQTAEVEKIAQDIDALKNDLNKIF